MAAVNKQPVVEGKLSDEEMIKALARRESKKIAQSIGETSFLANALGVPTIGPTLNVDPAVRVLPEVSTLAKTQVAKPNIADTLSLFGNIPAPTLETIPGVTAPTTRSVAELQGISEMLAPQVETTPLTMQDLLGGEGNLIGMTPEDITGIAATKLSQIGTKTAADTAKLDFLRKSTGVETAEQLTAAKLKEEGQQARATQSVEAEKALATEESNRRAIASARLAKVNLARDLIGAKIRDQTAKSALTSTDLLKEAKSSYLLNLAKTAPERAFGITAQIDPTTAFEKLQADAMLKPGTVGKLSKEEHDILLQIVSQSTLAGD